MKIYAGGYDDVADAAIIVVSAGAGQKPGETRLDLVNKNVAIFKSIIPEIAKRNFGGILLIVANPVDILTQVAQKLSGLRRSVSSVQVPCLIVQDLSMRSENTLGWIAEAYMHL